MLRSYLAQMIFPLFCEGYFGNKCYIPKPNPTKTEQGKLLNHHIPTKPTYIYNPSHIPIPNPEPTQTPPKD